jgi:hypothetical protein
MDLVNTFVGAAAINAYNDKESADIVHKQALTDKQNQLHDKENLLSIQRQHINELEARARMPSAPSIEEFELEREVAELREELETYKNLLSKPMLEIAEENGQFKKTYQIQQSKFAEWIISQRAYKELAMQYGKELGKNVDEIVTESEKTKEIVIQNKSEFNNNVDPKIVADLKSEEDMKLKKEIKY